MTARYPRRFRPWSVNGLAIIVGVPIGLIVKGVPAAPQLHPIGDWLTYWFVLTCLPLILLYGMRSAWMGLLFLHVYQLDGDLIEEYDPLLRRRRTLRIAEVRATRRFRVFQLHASPSTPPECFRGHVLVGRDGTEITLTEALPLWSEIAPGIENLPVETQPLLRRWLI